VNYCSAPQQLSSVEKWEKGKGEKKHFQLLEKNFRKNKVTNAYIQKV